VYPFVFLNLFMSAEAAFATPLILMSQNRSAERDREHAQHDYDVNVEAKREIEELMTTLARIEIEKLDKIMAALKAWSLARYLDYLEYLKGARVGRAAGTLIKFGHDA